MVLPFATIRFDGTIIFRLIGGSKKEIEYTNRIADIVRKGQEHAKIVVSVDKLDLHTANDEDFSKTTKIRA